MTDITIDRAVLEQALEALDCAADAWGHPEVVDAILALRDALNAPQPEPVATVMLDVSRPHMAVDGKYVGQKTDAKAALFFKDLPVGTPLYTAPPRREWVGLTVGDISKAWDRQYVQIPLPQSALNFARDIEQALKERNHE